MSSLGRSLKKQSPLSARSLHIRPRQTPLRRTYSNTSDIVDDQSEPLVPSGPNTPTREKTPESRSSRGSDIVSPTFSPPHLSPRLNSSRPIAIEMPQTRKATGVATSTPPEPLSARGDRPGGYFPLHEDPQVRVQRTHPFHDDRSQPTPAGPAKPNLYDEENALNPKLARPAASSTTALYDATPVTSYIPSGVHDSVLPMGKYYPSNYEKRNLQNQQTMRPPPPPGFPAKFIATSDSAVPTCASASASRNDSDVRRKLLQQYQRDMIAQATLAIGSAAKNGEGLTTPTGIALNGIPTRNQSFISATPAKPISPRLLPLGSPGPVTPMELESSEGSYLDKGWPSQKLEKRLAAGRVPSRRSPDEDLRRRTDTRSPPLKATRAL